MTGDENTAISSAWEASRNAREGTKASTKTAAVMCTVPYFKTGAQVWQSEAKPGQKARFSFSMHARPSEAQMSM